MSIKQTVARKYRTDNPDMPTLKLARIMTKENEPVFKDVEDARSVLRKIEGKSGAASLANMKDKSLVLEKPRPYNPYSLPASDETDYKPFVIKGYKRVGILSDIHLPYHSIEALSAAIAFLKKQKVDAILLNGDTIDFYGLSRFQKDPRKRHFAGELQAFKEFFQVLEKQFGCKIFFKIGNHEERYEHFLWQKAGELIGVDEFSFESIIKARANGISIIGDKRYMKLNHLNGIHGHEYVGGAIAPVNIARGLQLKAKVSAFQGHNHATSSHTTRDMTGKMTTTWSIGCLSELNPLYMPLNQWNHGFAVVDLDPNGKEFEFRNHTIQNGKVY